MQRSEQGCSMRWCEVPRSDDVNEALDYMREAMKGFRL